MTWVDPPKHVCRRSSLEGLVFCCPAEKRCRPRDRCMEFYGMTPEDFRKIKESYSEELDRSKEPKVCFGSLVWCCKSTRACSIRDRALEHVGLTIDEYMSIKKRMSEEFKRKYGK